MSTTIASWLLTYLLHSTVLLGIAFLVSRLLGEKQLALQEMLLRTALVGGIVTASLPVGLGFEPAAGALAFGAVERPTPVMAATDSTTPRGPEVVIPTRAEDLRDVGNAWTLVLLALWCGGSLLALLALGRSVVGLRRILETRHIWPADKLVERFATAMGLRRRVLLSTSKAISVPFATGIRKPEICCPERIFDLATEHRKGLLAHEVAHLARHDPLWQLAYRVGEAFFVLQPLNRLIRRRLEEIAEHLTDERAAACTGDRLGLARCLVVIAHWGFRPGPALPATGFASGPRLDRRVRRLLDRRSVEKPCGIWAALAAACLLAAISLTFPVVGSISANAETISDSPVSSPTKTWSRAEETPPTAPMPPNRVPLPGLPVPQVTASPSELPAIPAAPAISVASPLPVAAPAPVVLPVLEVAPVVLPVLEVAPVVGAPPASEAVPAPPVDTELSTPEKPPDPPAPEDGARSRDDSPREEARARQREAEKARAEAEARAREQARDQARAAQEQSLERTEQSRELARDAAERSHATVAEREEVRRRAEALRAEASENARTAAEQARERAEELRVLEREAAEKTRVTDTEREELRRRAETLRTEAREHVLVEREQIRERAEQLHELEREAADRARVSDAEREELRRRAEALRDEAREQVREMRERAKRLAEEAAAERRAEEERRQSRDPG